MERPNAPGTLLEERVTFIEKARSGSILDAAFYLSCFGHRGFDSGLAIAPEEVFEKVPAEFTDARAKAKKLLSNAYVGAAFHKYQNCMETYEEACWRMRAQNPGFSEDCYNLAAVLSIVGMR